MLRFDFLGLGDSSLESDEVQLEDWLASVELAAARARELSGASSLDFVGLRLSASLGALAAASGRVAFDRMVLWQPVVSGRALVEELRRDHREFATGLGAEVPEAGSDPEEFLGYRYRQTLLRELEGIELEQSPPVSAGEVIVFETAEAATCAGLHDAVVSRGVSARHVHAPDGAVWLAEPYKQVMPHESIRAIVAFLTGAQA